ncbi:MAG: polysaccharide biosynthesis/export family protein, partial [Prevotellamassilia sp.]
MKSNLILLLLAVLTLGSCKTREKIAYFQDATSSTVVATPSQNVLKLVPGDKVSIIVTSAATPELAERYNLSAGSTYSSSNATTENLRYTLDENGNIDMLGIGRIQIGGLTRSEAAEKIQSIFRQGILNDAVVTVAAYNQFITVLGD